MLHHSNIVDPLKIYFKASTRWPTFRDSNTVVDLYLQTMSDEVSDHSYDSGPDERPNRWTGAKSTWQSLTEQESGLAASLDQIRNRELNLHLYSTHAIKKRARTFRELQKKKTRVSRAGLPQEDELEANPGAEDAEEFDEAQGWQPPKVWTAWPLPPDLVPRYRERVGPDNGDEQFTFKRRDLPYPGRQLEEALLGATLKIARETFGMRDTAKGKAKNEYIEAEEKDEIDEEEEQTEEPEEQLYFSSTSQATNKQPASEPSPRKTPLIPVVSADDDISRAILRPSIRGTLSKLDAVLMALHNARRTCHRYRSPAAGVTDEEGQTSGTESQKSFHNGHAEIKNLASRPKQFKRTNSGTKKIASRPSQIASGSDSGGKVSIKKLKVKKAIRPLAASGKGDIEEDLATISYSNNSSPKRRGKKLLPRDWSEVMGAAALVGFSPDVIARATQRCSNLFGEGMGMRTMTEAPISAADAEQEILYQPEELLSDMSDYSESDAGEHVSLKSTIRAFSSRTKIRVTAYPCSIEGCPRKTDGFGYEYQLRSHLQKGHKLSEHEIDAYIDNYEEMDGAVHNDGFCKPIRPKRRAKKSPPASNKRNQSVIDRRRRKQPKSAVMVDSDEENTSHGEDSRSE